MRVLFLAAVLMVLYHVTPTQGYKAAVIEYYPVANPSSSSDETPENIMLKNLQEYRTNIDTAKDQGADIIVFPEYGLTTFVDNPEEYAVEINENDKIIKELKAMAEENGIYIVVNLLEKLQVASKKTKYYNTNLVFDRLGNIVHKYRKINLYNEPKLTPGEPNQALTFTTDFGVTYGVFTSYDILYENPSRRVLDFANVTDIVFPTRWHNTLPFFSALSVQHGYSLAYGVNLLAADYAQPSASIGGSGIYLSDGQAAELFISSSPSSKRLVQDITKVLSRPDKTKCPTIRPFGLPGDVDKNVTTYVIDNVFQSSNFKAKPVDLTQTKSTIDICHNEFCCNFTVVVNTTSVEPKVYYKVVAYQGSTSIDNVNHDLRICSLLACENNSTESCGNKIDKISTRFIKITVTGNLKNDENTFYVPSTLDTFLLPIRETEFCNKPNDLNSTSVQLTTTMSQENVIVFGLIGKTSSAVSIHTFGVFFLIVLVNLIAL